MGNSSSTPKISAQDKAILDMKNQRDKLHQYQKRITILAVRETDVAKQCLRQGNKAKALLALRRKKFQESLLSKADAQLEQLQQLMQDVEFAALQKDVMFGLEQGTAVLKQIHAEMGGIEGVEKLLEDNAEAKAYADEVSEMLGGQLTRADEEDVENELAQLEAEARVIATTNAASSVPEMPNTPQDQVRTAGQTPTRGVRQREEQMIPA